MSDERDKAIRERAYALWERDGSAHGQHGEHWDQAVREIDTEMATKARPGRKAAVTPVARAKPGPKPKVAVSSPAVTKPVAKPATPAKSAAAPKPEAVAKPASASTSGAVRKARAAADKVVATVKRATTATTKK